ncbi:MAG TPA: TolC family protein [Thermoanaerobaculia bacterium]|nr:TolC family protein [Thermoanaerobaculia bacterium]
MFRHFRYPICIAVACLALTAAAQEPLRLSRADAIHEALARNPALVAARAQVEEARAAVVTATAFADPTLALDVAGQSHLLNPGSGNASDQGVGFTVPFPGKRKLRGEVATADLKAAEFNLTQLQQQIASQAAQAYDAILVALRHRENLEQAKGFASDFVQKTQARFLAGTVAKVDVVKAQTDLASAENNLIANERAIATARASLNRALGRMAGAPIETTDTLNVPADVPAVEALEQLAENSRPELQALAAQLQGAAAATRLAKEFWAPDFNLSATRNAADGVPTTYTSAVSIGVPIFFWQHKRGEVASAQHREEELRANLNDIRAQVSLDVQTAFANASTSLRQAIFIRDHLLPEAQEVYRVASVSYGLGGLSALDLLDAKRTLLDAETQYVDALGAANDAIAALEQAVGAPLPHVGAGSQPAPEVHP